MFISKKHLSRRAVIRGLGTSVALPLLDAMIPAATALADTAANVTPRMGFVFFPHGAVMERWTPKGTGTDWEISEILSPVAKHKAKMTVVSGLRNKPAESPDPHGIIEGTWLRCVSPKSTTDGITCDQIAAQKLGTKTTFQSIEVGTPVGGPCAPGFSCSFGSSLAFRAPQQPLPIENNPRKLFYQLFGEGDNAAERAAIVDQTGSILDSIVQETKTLQNNLTSTDRTMVSNYLDSIRDIERRVTMMKSQDLSNVDIPPAPVGIPTDYEEHLKDLFDLVALAYQAGLTNIASYIMEKEVSMRTFTNIGVAEAFHPLSHHGDDPDKKARLARVQNYHTKVFNYFIDKLDAMPEGNGTVLDNSVILFGANMSNSNLHNNDPLPSAVFGHAGGTIKGGQHLMYPQDTPHANLLFTLLHRVGVPVEKFGDATGELSEV